MKKSVFRKLYNNRIENETVIIVDPTNIYIGAVEQALLLFLKEVDY